MADTGGSFGGSRRRMQGAGGTPGGFGEFFLGLALAGVGVYLVLNQVQVHTSTWRLWGLANGFGITMIPMLLGIGVLFFDGRSKIGWVLTVGGFGAIILGILTNMDIYFQRTSLWNTIIMFGMLAGGLGLIARSLRPHGSAARAPADEGDRGR